VPRSTLSLLCKPEVTGSIPVRSIEKGITTSVVAITIGRLILDPLGL
jgi:hypothetical protein